MKSLPEIAAPVASSVAVVVAGVVLVGWYVGSPSLIAVLPGLVAMNPATAVSFIFSGLSLGLLCREPVEHWRRSIGQALGMVVATTGLLRLGAYALGADAGVDQLLFPDKLLEGPFAPNRMAPNTALGFLLLGLALVLLDRADRHGRTPAEVLTLGVVVSALLALTGYAYAEGRLVRVGSYVPMALNTATVFAVLSAGILCARPDRGMMGLLTSDTGAGLMARRLLAASIGIPWLIGWLCLRGQVAGLYGTEFGASLFAVATMVVLTGVTWWTARALARAETKRRQAEVALQHSATELEAVNRELEAFSYSVSHDLRAPLRAIEGFGRILLEDHGERLDREGHRVLDVIRENARNMGRLIDDLLAFSRLGRKALEKSSVEMASLARTVVDEVRSQEPGRPVAIEIGPLPPATGDPRMLRQVLVNLVGNAWKFTRGRPEPTVEIGFDPGAGEVTYWVRDNGAGFDMQLADKLFGVFQRLHSGARFEGTGVGLALVKRIIERHGGRVWGEGVVDEGATFYFTLPARPHGEDEGTGSRTSPGRGEREP